MFIINTTSQHNIEEKASELREILGLNEGINLQWFSNYLVVKRASMETNFHQLYLMLLQKLEIKHVFKVITIESYTAVRNMLMSRDLL
mmetsp:Transcript_25500/g.4237  ORF Transcript_25500/g.4237 Transcript_25500/m.4237 type:complete len:88 (+) Transcript_25500:1357-1620(+)